MQNYILITKEEATAIKKAAATNPDLISIVSKINSRNDKAVIERAREIYAEEGAVEIDSNAIVSKSKEGAYVMGWLWVGKQP